MSARDHLSSHANELFSWCEESGDKRYGPQGFGDRSRSGEWTYTPFSLFYLILATSSTGTFSIILLGGLYRIQAIVWRSLTLISRTALGSSDQAFGIMQRLSQAVYPTLERIDGSVRTLWKVIIILHCAGATAVIVRHPILSVMQCVLPYLG